MEFEIKFYIVEKNLDRIRNYIRTLGGRYVSKEFETNIVLENKENELVSRNAILRLRHNGKNTLTYKEPPSLAERSQEIRVNCEIEVEVSDFNGTKTILTKLGFHELMKYERVRETFHFGKSKILIDNMPFGFFVEIEGNEGEIRDISEGLHLDWKKRIKDSYVRIFENLRRQAHLSLRDLTFENFREVNLKQLGIDKFIENYWQKAS